MMREYPNDNSPDEECNLDGHLFEGHDTVSEICTVCGLIREYPIGGRRNGSLRHADNFHVCRTIVDHAFGMDRKCIYCGKTEASLTSTEHEAYDAAKRARRGE